MRITNAIPIALAMLLMVGCQSPLVGTWIETSETSPQIEGEANLLVLGSDGTTVEQTMRNGRLQTSIPATYRTKGDILIIEDEPGRGCIRSEIAQRFRLEGDTLVLDDGTTRTRYQRLPPPTCLGVAMDSRRFEQAR